MTSKKVNTVDDKDYPTIHAYCGDASCGGDLVCDINKRCKKDLGGDCVGDVDCRIGLRCIDWKCSQDSADDPKKDIKEHKHSTKHVHWVESI